jgi:beta-lactamase regulating signal transducer with metallopeptidase domain
MMLALLLDLGWKSAAITGVALCANLTLPGRSPAQRTALLQTAVAGLLVLPILAVLLPALRLPWLPSHAVAPTRFSRVVADLAMTEPTPKGPMVDAAAVAVAVYWGGVLFLTTRFGLGIATLRRWTREARPPVDPHWHKVTARHAKAIGRPICLRVSPRAEAPFSWGIAPAWIVIGPATQDCPEQAEAIVAHEAAHIRRRDWMGLVASRLVTILFWFNPLIWLLAGTLAREAELAADAEALRDVPGPAYAEILLAVAGGRMVLREANAMSATRNSLARRIAASLAEKEERGLPAAAQMGLLLCAVALTGPIAAAQFTSPARPQSDIATPNASSTFRRQQDPDRAPTPRVERPARASWIVRTAVAADASQPTVGPAVAVDRTQKLIVAPTAVDMPTPSPVRIVNSEAAQVVFGAPVGSGTSTAAQGDQDGGAEGMLERAAAQRDKLNDLREKIAQKDEALALRRQNMLAATRERAHSKLGKSAELRRWAVEYLTMAADTKRPTEARDEFRWRAEQLNDYAARIEAEVSHLNYS